MVAPMRRLGPLLLATLLAGCAGAGPTLTPPAASAPPPTFAPISALPATPDLSSPTPRPSPIPLPTHAAEPGIGEPFVDPEGFYEIRVDPDWLYSAGGFAEGVEFWYIGPAENGLTPNVNLLTQVTYMTFEEFTEFSLETAENVIPGVEVLDVREIQGLDARLELLVYKGTVNGNKLRFLVVWGVSGERAVIATLTTPPRSFDRWRKVVEPYLRTLRLT
jgi:hypothetical protein